MQAYKYAIRWDGVKWARSRTTAEFSEGALPQKYSAIYVEADGNPCGFLYTTKESEDNYTQVALALASTIQGKIQELCDCQTQLGKMFQTEDKHETH